MRPILPTILCIAISLSCMAQKAMERETDVLLRKEYAGGLQLNTHRGWGLVAHYGWQKNYKYKQVVGLWISNIRHDKEEKMFSSLFEEAKGFYYGKLNSFLVFRPYYGGRFIVFGKEREKGVEISFKWGVGPSLGLLKPVYLEVRKFDSSGPYTETERYDPDVHFPDNIFGRAKWFTGLSESGLVPGVFGHVAANFDVATERDVLFGVELGLMVDGYFQRVPLMYPINENIKNRAIYPAFYANITFGRKSI